MASRQGFASVSHRSRNLSPISSDRTLVPTEGPNAKYRSATTTKMQKEIKRLSEENRDLKTGLVEMREAVKQIFTESRHEKFDERRINMMKFHVLQLERQNSILTESLGNRAETLVEVENAMAVLSDRLRSFISADVKSQMVPIARSDLMILVENTESTRIKLLKSVENTARQELGKDLLNLNPCIKNCQNRENPVTLLDISLNRMEFLNLRFVAQLESKLSVLYKELVRVHNQLDSLAVGRREGGGERDGGRREGGGERDSCLTDGHAPHHQREHVKTCLLKAGVMTKDCVDDLLSLSLLCPSAPWPVLKRPVVRDIPLDRVTSALPPLPQHKRKDIDHILKSCVGVLNHRVSLLQKEKKVLEEELAFHRSVYDTQMKYTTAVFDAVREGCKEFEDSARKLLCSPLQAILDAYKHLQSSKSQEALRNILMILKANESQIRSIVETFDTPETGISLNRSEALSSFSEDFMHQIQSLILSCQKERDAALMEKKESKDSMKKSEAELRSCIEELEAKYDKQWVSKYESIDSRLSPHQPSEPGSGTTDILSGRSSSGKTEGFKFSSGDTRRSKEFIHNQLFGDSDTTATIAGHDDDHTPTLKLRNFLDDDPRVKVEPMATGGGKSVSSKPWVSNFSASSLELERNLSGTSDSMDGQSEKVSSPQRNAGKPWRPDREWVSDFTSQSHLPDLLDNLTLTSRESGNILDSDSSHRTPQEKNPTLQHKDSRHPKDKGKRRTYEADLRVARNRLSLKRQGGGGEASDSKKP